MQLARVAGFPAALAVTRPSDLSILNEFSQLFRDKFAVLDILGQDDYETVIEFVSAGKCEQVRRYETEFGVPAPFPQSKGCH